LLPFTRPVTEIITERFSCRAYQSKPIAAGSAERLQEVMDSLHAGPLQTPLRFGIALATDDDAQALRGLGTYGLIKNPAGFLMGAAELGNHHLEDFGYGLEAVILHATNLGLNTCWLGGNFTKSSFSKRIRAKANETVPAVASIGYGVERIRHEDLLRLKVKSDARLEWERLFFLQDSATPLSKEAAGKYGVPLEMVRRAPSGHNYQPWRVFKEDSLFHFHLQRTRGYGPGSPTFMLLGVSDLQRLEIGIAMCHFELTARELGLRGRWRVESPPDVHPPQALEYVSTWQAE
jgi:nitroreductase